MKDWQAVLLHRTKNKACVLLPKCASQAIKRSVDPSQWKIIKNSTDPTLLSNRQVIVNIRHPLDRLVSAHKYFRGPEGKNYIEIHGIDYLSLCWSSLITKIYDTPDEQLDKHLRPQVTFLTPIQDPVLIKWDFKKLGNLLGCTIQKHNSSQRKVNWYEYFSDRDIELMSHRYKEDLKLWHQPI